MAPLSRIHKAPGSSTGAHRHAFDERLRSALTRAHREGSGVALVVIHAFPNCLDALMTMVRDTDVATHHQDGRFAVMIVGATPADVRRAGAIVADRLQCRVRAMAPDGNGFPRAVITVAGAGDISPQVLLDRAGIPEAQALA